MAGTSGSKTFLDQVNNLPTVPKAVRDLLVEFEKADVDVDRIIHLLSADPVLATKVLRLSNSAFYRRSGAISRISDAVVFLGLHAVRNLVLASGLAAGIKFPASFPRKEFWQVSLHSAVLARHLAREVHLDAEAAFATGLMRNIGEPLMYGVLGDAMQKLDETIPFYGRERHALEVAQFGFSSIDLASDIAERWHFPPLTVNSIRHSSASLETIAALQMPGVVQLASWMVAEEMAGGDPRLDPAPEVQALVLRLDLPPRLYRSTPPTTVLAAGLEDLLA